MKCFYCEEKVASPDIRFFAFEKPYVNIPVHRKGCLDAINGQGALKYFTENSERVHKYAGNQPDKPKLKRKGKHDI